MKINLSINDQVIVFNCRKETLFLNFIQAVRQACKEYDFPIPNRYFLTSSNLSYTTADLSHTLQELEFKENTQLSTGIFTHLPKKEEHALDLSLNDPVENILNALSAEHDTAAVNALLTLYYQHRLLTSEQLIKLRHGITHLYQYRTEQNIYLESTPVYWIYNILPMMDIPSLDCAPDEKERDSKKSTSNTNILRINLISYSLQASSYSSESQKTGYKRKRGGKFYPTKPLSMITAKQRIQLVSELKETEPRIDIIKTLIGDAGFISLRDENIGEKGAEAFATALKENRTLFNVDFSGNNIGDSGATAFAGVLSENTPLRKLILHKNGITDIGTIAIATALAQNTNLTKLNLDSNIIGITGARVLADALETNLTLLELKMGSYPVFNADLPPPSNRFIHNFYIVSKHLYSFAAHISASGNYSGLVRAIENNPLIRNRRHQQHQLIHQITSLLNNIFEPGSAQNDLISRIIINYCIDERNQYTPTVANEALVTPKDTYHLSQLLPTAVIQPPDNCFVIDIPKYTYPYEPNKLLRVLSRGAVWWSGPNQVSLREKLHIRDILTQIFLWCGFEAVADINGKGQLIINQLSQKQLQLLVQVVETLENHIRARDPNRDPNQNLNALIKKLINNNRQRFTETSTAPSNERVPPSYSSSPHSPHFFPTSQMQPQQLKSDASKKIAFNK
ncbi:MAG: hypothetical protein JSR33_12650 [Proteobacteria bacterium]|nr:hypothetical protein [Pseudomonadota bacterium]